MDSYEATTESPDDIELITGQAGSIKPISIASGFRSEPFRIGRNDIYVFSDPESTYWFPEISPLESSTQALDVQDVLAENLELRLSNARFAQQIEFLSERVTLLEEKALSNEPTVVVLREITREQAKEEIRELFTSGETLDYEAIVTRLNLGLELVVGLCDELMGEGEIGVDGETHQ